MDEYDVFYMKMLLSKLIVLLCKRRTLFFFTSSLVRSVRSVRTARCQNMSWMPIVLRSTLTSWNISYVCLYYMRSYLWVYVHTIHTVNHSIAMNRIWPPFTLLCLLRIQDYYNIAKVMPHDRILWKYVEYMRNSSLTEIMNLYKCLCMLGLYLWSNPYNIAFFHIWWLLMQVHVHMHMIFHLKNVFDIIQLKSHKMYEKKIVYGNRVESRQNEKT